MFGKATVRLLVAAGLAATTLGGTARAGFIPPTGLAPGSKYQVLFVTSDGTTAESSNIADYDSFVTQEANQSPTLEALRATWTAVASTSESAANQATNTTDIPIYDTQGDLLEPNFPDLFLDETFYGPKYTQFGTYPANTSVWTGSTYSGGISTYYCLGSDSVLLGETINGFEPGQWLVFGIYSGDNYQSLSLYAISSPITVPEPASLTLLGAALLGLGAFCLRRRGAKTMVRLLLAAGLAAVAVSAQADVFAHAQRADQPVLRQSRRP